MKLNEKQREDIKGVIKKSREKEYVKFNSVIANAVKEWKKGKKTNEQAYNKIYKKVIKNENRLSKRYADLDDAKMLRTLTEIFTEDLMEMLDFDTLDMFVKKEVYRIAGIQAHP